MITHYWIMRATDGKYYIQVFSESRDGKKTSAPYPEAHESLEDAQDWARVHTLPILEAQAV